MIVEEKQQKAQEFAELLNVDASKIIMPKKSTKKRKDTIKYLSEEDVQKILDVPKADRDQLIIMFSYYYGLRAGEVSKIRWQDIDFKKKQIYITRLKNSVSGIYPLYKQFIPILSRYKAQIEATTKDNASDYGYMLKVCTKTVLRAIKQACDKADVKLPEKDDKGQAVFRSILRHSLAVHLLLAQKDGIFIHNEIDVQHILGHRNISNTMVYAEITGRRREATRETIEKGLPFVRFYLNRVDNI